MAVRIIGPLVAASFLCAQLLPQTARAENRMGYQLLSSQEAANLAQNGGRLGLDVERAQQISDAGMIFEIMRVKAVRPGSAGAQAGFNVGDQIIAINSRVFPSIAAFAAYVGATPPGRQLVVDYMPARGGPQQAQRVSVTAGPLNNTTASYTQPSQDGQPVSHGMSTGTKVAIGVGAVALLGCYEAGCFSSHRKPAVPPQQPIQGQTSYQQR
ncbi:MAG: PDZ domain-containing protein [Janthinobacterium lividum]